MNRLKLFIIIIILSIISSFILVGYTGKKLNKKLYNYVNFESKRIVSNVVNYSINEIIAENIIDDLFEITKNNRGEIELLDYNTKEVNKLLQKVNQSVQKELVKLEEGKVKEYVIAETFKQGKFKQIKSGIICEIPLGVLKENALSLTTSRFSGISLTRQLQPKLIASKRLMGIPSISLGST